jgi:hypothetical protein
MIASHRGRVIISACADAAHYRGGSMNPVNARRQSRKYHPISISGEKCSIVARTGDETKSQLRFSQPVPVIPTVAPWPDASSRERAAAITSTRWCPGSLIRSQYGARVSRSRRRPWSTPGRARACYGGERLERRNFRPLDSCQVGVWPSMTASSGPARSAASETLAHRQPSGQVVNRSSASAISPARMLPTRKSLSG